MTAVLPGRNHETAAAPEASESCDLDVLHALGNLPLQVRDNVGINARGQAIYALSQVGSSVVRLTATGRSQATMHTMLHTAPADAYTGPRVTPSEVAHRRAHGQWLPRSQ